MDVAFDYSPKPGQAPAEQSLDRLQSLQSAYQKALGHELPNQFVAMQGLARLLHLELADQIDPALLGSLKRLADLAKRLDGLVRTLANLGRLLRNPGPVEPIALDEFLPEVAIEVKLLFREQSIEYHYLNPLTSFSYPRRPLHDILFHLLRNAVQAAGAERAVRIDLSATVWPDALELSVADNGKGIPESLAERVGEAFWTTDPTGDRQGLGLFIVRQLVAQGNGVLRLRSQVGQGTQATVRLPRVPPKS